MDVIDMDKMKLLIQKNFILIVAVLLLAYLLLLIYAINSPGLFVGDERINQASVFALLDGRMDSNSVPLLAKTIWYYFVYVFSSITGGYSPFFYRFGTIIFGLGSLLIFYKITRLLFSKFKALLCTILLAIDPMFFSFSRILQPDIIALFFLLSGIYYFVKCIDEKKPKSYYLSGIFIGLALSAKFSSILLILLFPTLLFIFSRGKKLNYRAIVKKDLIFLLFSFLAFVIGNGIFFFKIVNVSFLEFVYGLFKLQFGGVNVSGSLYSPAWSWLIIPQILTLFRVPQGKQFIESVVVFVNPVISLVCLPTLVVSIIYVLKKGILKQKKLALFILIFLCLYIPMFLSARVSFYNSVLPLVPLILIMFAMLLEKIKNGTTLLLIVTILSVFIFAIYYPLLVGIKVPKSYESKLLSFSLYKFSKTNSLFCQQCYPRK